MSKNEQNEFYQEQRRRNLGPKPDVRGTLETVGLESQNLQSQTPRWLTWIINGLAVIGGLAILYLIVTLFTG